MSASRWQQGQGKQHAGGGQAGEGTRLEILRLQAKATYSQQAEGSATEMATTKQAPKNTGNRKFGAQRGNKRTQVVSMRDKKNLSWAVIADALDIAPRTARRLYDEKKGAGAHVGLLPGKGGRLPVAS